MVITGVRLLLILIQKHITPKRITSPYMFRTMPNMEYENWKHFFFKMATAKKLTRAKISSLSIAGKALSENIVFERVSREAGTNFGYYFESCSQTSPVEQLESSGLFRGFVKRCSDTFFDLFSERATGSQDKYALMQMRWYEFVREMLTSQEVCDMVKEMVYSFAVVTGPELV